MKIQRGGSQEEERSRKERSRKRRKEERERDEKGKINKYHKIKNDAKKRKKHNYDRLLAANRFISFSFFAALVNKSFAF